MADVPAWVPIVSALAGGGLVAYSGASRHLIPFESAT